MKKKKVMIFVGVLIVMMTCFPIAICYAYLDQIGDYSYSTHPDIFTYKGYVQVQGSYLVPEHPGYGLESYVRHNIKQGTIKYSVAGKVKGTASTTVAGGRWDTTIRRAKCEAKDSLNPWAEKTVFTRKWYPMD